MEFERDLSSSDGQDGKKLKSGLGISLEVSSVGKLVRMAFKFVNELPRENTPARDSRLFSDFLNESVPFTKDRLARRIRTVEFGLVEMAPIEGYFCLSSSGELFCRLDENACRMELKLTIPL